MIEEVKRRVGEETRDVTLGEELIVIGDNEREGGGPKEEGRMFEKRQIKGKRKIKKRHYEIKIITNR